MALHRLGKLDVEYRQIAVFTAKLAKPFNDWTEEHVRQGFAWRSGSVSFQTLDDGPIDVAVIVGAAAIATDASRAIRVPFRVDRPGKIEIATP